MIRKAFGAIYYKVRGHQLGDEVVPTPVLLGFASRKIVDLIRGAIYRPFYGSVAHLHFRGKAATIRNPRHLHMGSNVTIGPGADIDAFADLGIHLGSRVTIGADANLLATAVIREPGTGIQIGDDTSIGRANLIWGQGGVTIGTGCLLGPHVGIFSENHIYNDRTSEIRLQGSSRKPVVIEDDCWIGAGAKILAGVVVGRGTVVAAGAVVTKSVEPYSIVGGVPAKVIGKRTNTDYSMEQP